MELTYLRGMERLSQSSKRVGAMRELSPGVRDVIVPLCTEVARVDICYHLTWVLVCTQESSDEFVETQPFWASQLDRAVHWWPRA